MRSKDEIIADMDRRMAQVPVNLPVSEYVKECLHQFVDMAAEILSEMQQEIDLAEKEVQSQP